MFTMHFEIFRQKVLYKCKNIVIIQVVMASAPKENQASNFYLARNLSNMFPCLCHYNWTSVEQGQIEHSCSSSFCSSCWFIFSYQGQTRIKYVVFSLQTDTLDNVKHFVHKDHIFLSTSLKC